MNHLRDDEAFIADMIGVIAHELLKSIPMRHLEIQLPDAPYCRFRITVINRNDDGRRMGVICDTDSVILDYFELTNGRKQFKSVSCCYADPKGLDALLEKVVSVYND